VNTPAQVGNVIRCILVEDQVMFSQLLAAVMKTMDGVEVVAAASTVREGKKAIKETPADLLIVDLGLPDGSGLELVDYVARQRLGLKIIVLTGQPQLVTDARIKSQKIFAVVDKMSAFKELRLRIPSLHAGKNEVGHGTDSQIESLTPRELEIFRLIGTGLTNKEVADKLFISPNTMVTHRKSISRKLHLSGSALVQKSAMHFIAD